MAELPLTINDICKSEMEYNGKFGNTLVQIQNIDFMSILAIYYTASCMGTHTVAPTLLGFQSLKRCIQYLDSQPDKPIFYPSYYYDGSNVIRLTWSGNQVEDYTTKNVLELNQDADHARVINIRQSVTGIIYCLFGVSV